MEEAEVRDDFERIAVELVAAHSTNASSSSSSSMLLRDELADGEAIEELQPAATESVAGSAR